MKVNRTMNKTYDWQNCKECGLLVEEVSDDVYYCERCDYAFTEHQLFEFWKEQDKHDDYDRLRDLDL